jgi:serine phosphatase RsbU (regulator of sigma subunit)
VGSASNINPPAFKAFSASRTLAGGDILLVSTHGFVEAEDDEGEEYGESRMLATLNRHAGGTLPRYSNVS